MPTPPTPPTPKKTPLPPGVVELLKTLDTPPGAPPVDIPLPSQPDVGAARIELMDAMRRGVARQLGPGTDAAFAQDVGAADLLKPIQVVPKTPTWGESMARALLPQITVVDERPVAPEDLTPSTATVRPVNTTEQRVDAAKQAVKRQAATMATLPFKPLEYLSSWAFGTPSDALETALVGPSQQVPLSQVAGGLGRAMLSPTSETGKMLAPVASPIAAALIGTERAALGSEEYRRRYVDQVRDDDEIPLAAENTALYALRVLGTAAPALVTEGLLRLPVGVDVPAVKAAAARARQTFDAIVRGQKEGTASELAGAAVDVVTATPFTFGELLGAPAGHNVRVRREGEAARYAEGVLERIENGDGLEVDLARAATNRLGPEYADTGWWAGLVLDVLTNWEGAVTKPGAAAAKLARDVGTLRTLRGGSVFDNIRAAALNPTVDIAERTVRPLVADLEQGKAALTDVRPELLAQLQPFLDDLARQRKGMTFEEVALVDGWRGVGVGEATEEYARRLNAAKAKEAEAVAASRALARRADEGVEDARLREVAIARSTEAAQREADRAVAARPVAETRSADVAYLLSPRKLEADLELVREGKHPDLEGLARRLVEGQRVAGVQPAKGKKLPTAEKLVADPKAMERALLDARQRARGARDQGKRGLEGGAELVAEQNRRASEQGIARAREGRGVAALVDPADPAIVAARRLAAGEPPAGAPRPRLPTVGELDTAALDAAREGRAAGREARAVAARGPDLGPTPDRGFTPAKTPEEVAAEGVGGTARVAPPRTRAPKVTAGLAEFYTLRNKGGDAIESGDFETVSQLAQRRRLEGDTVYRGGDVPIARWEAGDAGVQRLVTTPVASDVEAALFSRVPPAPALRQFRTPADRAFANAVVDVLTDAPALGRRGPPASDAGRILEDAVRMWARDRLGADELVALPNGALVTPRDRAQIVEPVQAALERAGLVAGKTPNAAAVQELAARWGYDLPPTGIRTAEQLRGLRNAGISFEGRGLADWRSRVRGQPAFHRRMLEAIATLHTDQKVAGRARAAIKPYVGWLTKAFLDDPAIRLPPQVKTVWKETRNQLERVADDLFGEVEQALAAERKRLGLRWLETMDPAPVLRKFMAHEARLAGDEVRRAELPHEGMSTAALDAEVDAVVGDPRFPAWAVESTDPLVRRAGLAGWSERVLAERDAVARRYLRAALESGGVTDIVGTNLGERLAGLDRELLGEVWRELFERGLLDGPATKGAVQQLAPKVTIEPGVAALSFLAHKRADDIVNAQLARLGEAGVVVPEGTYRMRNPRDQGVLGAMLRGDHRSMVDGRWTYHYPPAAIAWAERTLDAMGLEAGSGAVLRPLTLGGNETVWVPNYLHPQLESMLAAGRLRPAVVRSAYAKLEQLWKTNALQGVVVPNPTFFTGQLLSIVPQLWTTRGAAGAATGPARLLTHGREVGELMRRLGGPESYHTPPASPFDGAVVTRQGEVWAMNDLEAVLRDAGMADTRAAVETGPELQKVLDRETAFLQRAGLPLRVVNDTVRNVAGSIDQAARLGVFLDDVLAGIPPATAAQNARKALLDYRDLTEFERTWMRRIFTFYAYMRKTSDATIEAMFTHPERFAQQARLWHQYQTFGLTAEEKGQLRDEDIARVFLPDWPMRVGKYVPPPIYKGLRPQSTPVGPSENLAVLLTLGAPFLVPDRVLEGLAPIPAIGAAAFQGVSITGEGFDTPEKNVIPPVLMDNPITGDILRGLVAAGPEEITADDWHRGRYPSVSATAANLGRPSYWSAGSGLEVKGTSKQLAARTLWQSIRMAAARTPTSAEGLARGAGALEPTPYTQQDQEALAWLLGMRLVPAPTATEARRRAEATYTGKVKRAARDLAPPSGAR